MRTVIILGSGFDIDLGLGNSCAIFSNNHYCPTVGNKTWSAFEYRIREEVISWYANGKNEEKAEELNLLWRTYVKNISWFFTEQSDKFKCNKNACAYKFLKRLNPISKIKVYTFNYTNPFEYVDFPQLKDFTHVHGRHCRDSFNKDLMVMSQGHEIILGIDECIPQEEFSNPNIHALIKKNHPKYKDTEIVYDLSKAQNVILYGFAMGKTDWSYFDKFFNAIKHGSHPCEKLYYVTYDKYSFKDFISNLKGNGFKTDRIRLIPIYTKYGSKNRQFRKMLKDLLPYTRYKSI